jgi:hypothetical protein
MVAVPSVRGIIASATLVLTAACSAGSPTGPTALSVEGLRVTPEGAGVQYGTNFQFELTGSFPPGTQFSWQFGDGATLASSTPSASHTYRQTGSFAVTADARAGSSTGSSTRQVLVGSLVGRWVGTITGHTNFRLYRPIPIRRFDLTVTHVPVPEFCPTCTVGSSLLHASWSDDAGCRESSPPFHRGGIPGAMSFIYQSFPRVPRAEVSFGIEQFYCNADRDLYLVGTANGTFDRVEGTCPLGGPDCRFSMVRQ